MVLAFFATRGGQCEDAARSLEARARRASRACRSPPWRSAATATTCAATIRRRGWRFPVGYDRDGALANLYGVAVCPQITLADRGGRVRRTLHRRGQTRRRPAARAAPRWRARRQASGRGGGARASPCSRRAGSPTTVREEFPDLRLRDDGRRRAARGKTPPEVRERLGAAVRPLPRRAGDRAAPRAGPLGLPRLLPPRRPRPRHARARRSRRPRVAAAASGAASRPRNLLDDALLIALVETGRARCGRSTPTASASRWGSARRRRAPGGRRRRRPARHALRRDRRRPRGHEADHADAALHRPGPGRPGIFVDEAMWTVPWRPHWTRGKLPPWLRVMAPAARLHRRSRRAARSA